MYRKLAVYNTFNNTILDSEKIIRHKSCFDNIEQENMFYDNFNKYSNI